MRFYSAPELAELLHLSIHTIRDKIARGDFGLTLNTGRKRLVSQENLDRYITDHTGTVETKATNFSSRGKSRYRCEIAKL